MSFDSALRTTLGGLVIIALASGCKPDEGPRLRQELALCQSKLQKAQQRSAALADERLVLQARLALAKKRPALALAWLRHLSAGADSKAARAIFTEAADLGVPRFVKQADPAIVGQAQGKRLQARVVSTPPGRISVEVWDTLKKETRQPLSHQR